MANPSGKKPTDKKAAGSGKNTKKPGRKLGVLYITSGDKLQRKNRFCPKCGPGYFLALHSNRQVCGKCSYTEFK